jgi:hypothetical protein
MYYCYCYVLTTISNIIVITHCLLIVGSQFLMVKKLSKMGAQLKSENCKAMVITAHKLGYNLSKNGCINIYHRLELHYLHFQVCIIYYYVCFVIFYILVVNYYYSYYYPHYAYKHYYDQPTITMYYGHESIFAITINVTHISATVAPCCF